MIGYEDLDESGGWRPTPALRFDLVPACCYRRLGALSLRPLGLHRSLGLHLGG